MAKKQEQTPFPGYGEPMDKGKTLLEAGTRSSTPDLSVGEIDSIDRMLYLMALNQKFRQKKRVKSLGKDRKERLQGLFGSNKKS